MVEIKSWFLELREKEQRKAKRKKRKRKKEKKKKKKIDIAEFSQRIRGNNFFQKVSVLVIGWRRKGLVVF